MAPAGRHGTTERRSDTRWQMTFGFLVVLGAGVVTAHGLFEVATKSAVPPAVAWLYPLITDGLALVAYASAMHLSGKDRKYAWTVVVLAAGLSGLAQAALLAAPQGVGGGIAPADPTLRFGVGAWPAIAAAIAAHLLFLLREARQAAAAAEEEKRIQDAANAAERARLTAEAQAEAARAETARVEAQAKAEAEKIRAAAEADTVVMAPARKPTAKRKAVKAAAPAPLPEIGKGSGRTQMIEYLDTHGNAPTFETDRWVTRHRETGAIITGGELDRMYGTNNYGRTILKQWIDRQRREPQQTTAVV